MTDQITPRAAPPISIGPFSNVPAPGSPIRSDWPQQITQYVLDQGALGRGFSAFTNAEIGIAISPQEITIAQYTLTAADKPGWYHLSFVGQTWTNQNMVVRLYNGATQVTAATCSQIGDYCTIATLGFASFAVGNTARVTLTAQTSVGGLRSGANLQGNWYKP